MSLFLEVDRLKAELDVLRPLSPEQEARVLQKFRLEWNYNSNAIEGNSLTLGETRSLLLHGLTASGKPMRDHLDIKGHNEAVLALEEFVRSEYPLTEQFIREMHQVLLGEAYRVSAQTADGQPTSKLIQPGQYKTSPNNVLTKTGEMFYFATVEETQAKMTDLVTWYREEEATPTLHPVALAAEFHYRFVRIHPFDDGNGRMSRLLMNLILLRHGYPMTVIKNDDRNRYLAALSAADADEPEPFLRFIIENVEASLRLMIRAAKGESIDEPDDLDKKLALLKKQVLSRSEFDEITWNVKTQAKLFDDYIRFWLTDFVAEMTRFNDLFQKSELSFHARFDNTVNVAQSPPAAIDTNTALKAADARFNSLDPLDLMSQAMLLFRWETFRGLAETFDQTVNLCFVFTERRFNLLFAVYESQHGGQSQSVIEADYKTSYDLVRIHEINHQLATKVYEFIASKVTEADSAPS
ncbi:Fic family protein [Hymenobacter sp. BT18]|uniref:Fic family protein n=1 Tax=Hymenobacter sp. BT18 TaxID=2835648 RepID=UPI00143EC7DC|nr:Fic family protein [Hymenobacter sp. BT18]QIX60749.1 Fic family protein [Hymenobacter sp. BT18]